MSWKSQCPGERSGMKEEEGGEEEAGGGGAAGAGPAGLGREAAFVADEAGDGEVPVLAWLVPFRPAPCQPSSRFHSSIEMGPKGPVTGNMT